ncbi:MAG TPA: plastocyanin/azurin family copper-binding protein [Candidatus Sulfomarinibacteraceae bacterium]|nr:plastocyanin/azurin family copper-binding protein [Candidatus Sulfomarinibacteraceae bacterium]
MKRLLVLFLVVLALGITACSAGGGASGPQEVTITASDIAFDTERVEVAAGREVVLTLRNEGALEHDFSVMHIPAHIAEPVEEDGHDMSHMEEMPELHVSAMPGESHSVTFTPSEAGEYVYFCTVEGHEAAGMTGTLVVTAE